MNKRKMIKQKWIVAAVILLVMMSVLAALYLLQQENLKAAANAKKYSQEELQEQLAEGRQVIEETLAEQYPSLSVRNLTDEERAALREGRISREVLIAALLDTESTENAFGSGGASASGEGAGMPGESGSASSAPPESEAPGNTASPTAPPAQTEKPGASDASEPASEASAEPSPQLTQEEEYQAALAALVAEMYVMREEFVVQLDGMMAQAKAEYKAMPESERTKTKLASWASGYVSKAGALEKQCDAQMDDIVDRAKKLVKQYNADPSIIQTLIHSYAVEKSIQKSLYIQELEKRGIL